MPGFDLHTHTVMSDGTTTIEDNVRAALDLGLEGLGVTDHDTTEPFERARQPFLVCRAVARGEPIRSPVSGQPHRVRIDIPNGIEFELAEIGSAVTTSERPSPLTSYTTNCAGE